MQKRKIVWIGLVTSIFLAAAAAETPGSDKAPAQPNKSGGPGQSEVADRATYVQVALWDVAPGKAQAFEAAVGRQFSGLQREPDVVNARVLKNLSELNSQYVTYLRYGNLMTAEDHLAKQIAVLGPLCSRNPETHLIRLARAYSPAGVSDSPTGTEFAVPGTGQIAHLGMWIPFARFRDAYNQVLGEIKVGTMNQHNPGYIGEETGDEVRKPSPEEQTPYSPHAKDPEAMSINYGEFKTFQAAEESFLAHRDDRDARSEMQIFFGSLQVPTRFYIFQVVQSYDNPGRALGQNHQNVNSTEALARR